MTGPIFHPEAREEVREAAQFYESRLDGLGERFLTAVEQAAERIEAHPRAGAPLAGGMRKRVVRGFPYSIIYSVAEEQIYLVAVAHQHRRPEYWRNRTTTGESPSTPSI